MIEVKVKDRTQNGKGDTFRPVKSDVFRDNFDSIFRVKKVQEKPKNKEVTNQKS